MRSDRPNAAPFDKIPDKAVRRYKSARRVRAWFFRPEHLVWYRRLYWKRLCGLAVTLALGAYISAAVGLFCFHRFHRQVDTVRFVDILVPFYWPQYRVALGEHQLARGRAFAAEGKFPDAFFYLRTGLARSPKNRDSRLLLARLLQRAGRDEPAQSLLLEGLAFHETDAAYVRPLLTLLWQRREHREIISLSRRLLPPLSPSSELAQFLTGTAAAAFHAQGDYDAAEDFLRGAARLSESRNGRLLLAKIDWDRGYRDLALLQFRRLAADVPHDLEIHRELWQRLRATGQFDEARRASLAFHIAHPSLAEPRLELLEAYRQAGDTAQIAREVDALVRDFPTDSRTLLALGDFAVNIGDTALAHRLASHAAEYELPTEPFDLLAIEALLVTRDYRGVLESILALRQKSEPANRQTSAPLLSFSAIAEAGLGNTADASAAVARLLREPQPRAENLLAVANRLTEVGAKEFAHQTLVRANEIDPRNQAVITRLVELDLELNRVDALVRHVQHLLTMRRPPRDLLRAVQHKMAGDMSLPSDETRVALEAVRVALEKAPTGEALR